jgi:GTP-binding protein
MMYDWMLHQGFAPIIIATKADKLKRSQLAAHVGAIREGLSMDEEAIIIPFSAETKQGRDEIWALIDSLVLPEEDGLQNEDGRGGQSENPAPEKVRKPRWKDTDRPVAKKTLKKASAKKAKAKKRK